MDIFTLPHNLNVPSSVFFPNCICIMFGFSVRYLINEHETIFAFQMGVHDKYFKHLNRIVNRHIFIELQKVLYR